MLVSAVVLQQECQTCNAVGEIEQQQIDDYCPKR